MKNYTIQEQIAIFNRCKTATELLNTKELIEETQGVISFTLNFFNFRMNKFLIENLI